MFDCQSIKFYSDLAQKRTATANAILGNKKVKRILAFALYLFGARRSMIAQFLTMPQDTLKSFINRVFTNGISAFEDNRRKTSSFIPSGAIIPRKPSVFIENDKFIADFGIDDNMLFIPVQNTLQIKTIVLSMLNNELITTSKAAKVLGCSTVHILRQNQSLETRDVHSLIDKRQGLKRDYLFSPETKAELVLQFAANAVTGRSTSSGVITEQLNKECKIAVSDRSVRSHMAKLGLPKIAKSLPALVERLKKTSRHATE
jgi:hypothetical protein